MELSTEILGILAAFVAGLLSLIPALGATEIRRNLTAIIVLVLGMFFYGGFEYTTLAAFVKYFITAAVYAVVTYKIFVQNFIEKPAQRAIAARNPSYASKMDLEG
jgi:hypothetical protein